MVEQNKQYSCYDVPCIKQEPGFRGEEGVKLIREGSREFLNIK
jgi:hypothetical protein